MRLKLNLPNAKLNMVPESEILKRQAWESAKKISDARFKETGVRIPPKMLMPPESFFHTASRLIYDRNFQVVSIPSLVFEEIKAPTARPPAPSKSRFERVIGASHYLSAALVGAVVGYLFAGPFGAIGCALLASACVYIIKKNE